MRIPYVNIAAQHGPIRHELLTAIGRVIDHGQFILGNEVTEFEHRFAEICGVRYAVGVNSGTDALILALKAIGIRPGDEVITVPNSFISSAGCIALLGARPVFVDVRDDYNIDPTLIEQAITPRTRAIIPVHFTGRPADMNPILEVVQLHRLHVIEDCAQAVIAEYNGKRVGSFGTVGCFSLHPLKTLNACGDGGVLTTDVASLAEEFRILRNIGLRTRDECIVWSGNSRLDTILAAILMVKLNYLQTWTEKRRYNAQFYQKYLSDIPQVQVPFDKPHERAVYHTFVIQADHRDELQMHLAKLGVGTAIHYPVPIHLQMATRDLSYTQGSFPVSERQAKRILSLPIYPELTDEDLKYVTDGIQSFY